MDIKILVVGVIKKDNQILMRKKPKGSPPYKETWYLFGAELTSETSAQEAIQKQVEKQTGIKIKFIKPLGWDTEIKIDHDGKEKLFVYLDSLCEYISGDLKPSKDIEKIEWIDINNLKNYDMVPPSKALFRRLGYI